MITIIIAATCAAIFVTFSLLKFIRQAHHNTYQLRLEEVHLPQLSQHSRIHHTLHILQISDMHMENLSVSPAELLKKVKGRRIDFIALTGDFLDRHRSLPKLETYLQALQAIQPRFGTFAVLGNHDYVLKEDSLLALRALFMRYDVHLLRNEHVTLDVYGRPLQVVGIDDYASGHSDIGRSFAGLCEGQPRLVLTHDPNVILELAHQPFQYLLAGHFHGGQIHWPKPYHLLKMGKLARQQRVRGLHYEHGRAFYISEGLGQTGVNLRSGSLPEITLHHLPLEISQ